MGPVVQLLFYFIIRNQLSYNTYIIFEKYNYVIFTFNLLPIYPLDGGRILNLLFQLFISYKKSLYFSIFISIIISIIILSLSNSIAFLIVMIFLIVKILEELYKIKFCYNKFLLERYLNDYRFNSTKLITSINCFYREKFHMIKCGKGLLGEKEALKKYFCDK